MKPSLNFLNQSIFKSIIIIIFQIFLNLIPYFEKLIVEKFEFKNILVFMVIY
jgi:hypothetical protein